MLKVKTAIGAALAGAFVLGAIVVGFSSAQTDNTPRDEAASHAPRESEKLETSFSDLQEDEIRDLVRAYLLDNPEVIIEAVNVYSTRERAADEARTRQLVSENLNLLTDPAFGYVAGKNPQQAKVAVIELFDYHCGYCKRAAGLVQEITKTDSDVKVVFRELPLLRKESEYAAEMALAAREQGKFLEFHFAMLNSSGVLTKERVQKIARDNGLDVAKMEAEIEKGEIVSIITENHQLAGALGIDYTPAFIIASLNGEFVDFVPGFDEDLVKEKIKQAKEAAG
ncbi:DsbA family protein [Hyphococcus flavus]|uniref:DsbA family protein n=1 Tax=Hyphococcus flavus TaxID=1866326 RepID=A0AAF0CGN0_9PROT|nr:DsbA family protein [Hyphococcus flavus]WDI30867.1 DsbA family protein [Hyphococcus flavus]